MKSKCMITTVLCLLAIPLHGDNWFKKLLREVEVPAELKSDVDTIRMPRSRSSWNPLNFPPYRVAKYHRGTTHTKGHSSGFEVSGPPFQISQIEVVERSRRHDSFTLNDPGGEVFRCECFFHEGATQDRDPPAASSVDCTFTDTNGQSRWNLAFNHSAAPTPPGVGEDTGSPGRLEGSAVFDIDYLYAIRGSALIGDVPAGYVFTLEGKPVAALQGYAEGPPTKLTLKRSLTEDQRSAIAAAIAALVVGE